MKSSCAVAALMLLCTSNAHPATTFSDVRNKGLFSAIADEKAKFANLSDRLATADDPGDEDVEYLRRSRNRHKRRKRSEAKKMPTHYPTMEKTMDEGRQSHSEASETSVSTFGTSLFSELCSNSPLGNILISPLSVHEALTLVKDGATIGSNNEAELLRVLGSPSKIDESELRADDDSGVQLNMASSIWADSLRRSYTKTVTKEHSDETFPLPKNYTEIDEWIEDETQGMIKGFMGDEEMDPHTVALIVNAVYFKGRWTREFDPANTVDGEFVLRDGSLLPARFMTDTREVLFNGDTYELGGASMILLDYGKNASEPSDFASLFILPESPDAGSMDAVVSGLDSQPISELLENTFTTKVVIKLPRFRVEFGPAKIKPSLENMGMHDAFNEHIDHMFDEMSKDPTLFVEDVLVGAVVEVTEEGTEAAGTTVVPIRNRSRPRPPPEVTFDRPFVVAIVHRATGTPVFIGKVEEPDLLF